MNKEYSCGAVITQGQGNRLRVLLVRHNASHWSFPKGHMEQGETREETALREILEETGLVTHLDNGFRAVTVYSPKPDTIKEVTFFSARPESGVMRAQPEEIAELGWYSPDEAASLLTYESDRTVLNKALEYLNSPRS